MKRTTLSLVFIFCSLNLFSDDSLPRVSLQAPLFEEGSSQLATISYTVFDTAGLILSMLGQYDLLLNRDAAIEDPAAYCLENSVDRFISGRCSVSEEGGYDISLSVYDSETAGIVAQREETADTALDVFDAVDRLVIPLLEELSGRQIAFGTIALDNRGAEGDYRFFLDGVEYAPEEEILERILFGTHMIRIEQDRMDGRYVAEHKSVEVVEDGVTSFRFTIPGILGREERNISVKEDLIDRHWNNRLKAKAVDQAFAELLVMLEDVSYSSDMAARKDEILSRQEEWEALKYDRKYGEVSENRRGRMILSLGMDILGSGVYDPDSYKSYDAGDPIDYHVTGLFVLPKIGLQYFLKDHHALTARMAVLGGDAEVTPETVANSDGNASVQGTVEGGVELTLGYEYYLKKLFFGVNAEARALNLQWDTASDSGTLTPPGGDTLFGFSLEPKIGMLLNQSGNFVYKVFLSVSSSLYALEGEGVLFQPLDGVRIGFSAGYGGFHF